MGLRKRWTKKGSPAQLRDNSESKVGKLREDRLADIAPIILHSRESRMIVSRWGHGILRGAKRLNLGVVGS